MGILTGFSKNPDEELAIKELAQQIVGADHHLSLVFFSNHYSSKKIESSLKEVFGEKVVAVSTAGEITKNGYGEHSISGVSFCGAEYAVESVILENLKNLRQVHSNMIKNAVNKSEKKSTSLGPRSKSFCIMLIDGLSGLEEVVTEFVGNELGGIPLVGGSSGDGLNFVKTSLFFNGKIYESAAVLVFVTTTAKFEVFKTQHFETSDKKLVITEANSEKRVVYEINGMPAALAYADILGLDVENLSAEVYSRFPLVLRSSDNCFVRSIQKVNSDGSLTFYCAIEKGLVLSVAYKGDIFEATKNQIDDVAKRLGGVSSSLFFECILRRLEVQKLPEEKKSALFSLYNDVNAVGFHTYGEQFGLVHINQTLTGVIFGSN